MKLVYMGTPDIARVCLEKLHTAGLDIAAVYTKPDTPKNRGMKMMAAEVKQYAESVGLPVIQPVSFRDDAVVEELRGAEDGAGVDDELLDTIQMIAAIMGGMKED